MWRSSPEPVATPRHRSAVRPAFPGRKPAAEIYYLTHLRLFDGAPLAIEHIHIPAALVPGLTGDELEQGDLYQHLAGHGGQVIRTSLGTRSSTPSACGT